MTEHVSSTAEGKGFITAGAVKCVSDGSEQVVCDKCGQTFTRAISAHKYEVSKEIPATCTEAAKVVSICKDCGAEKTEVKVDENGVKSEPKGHDFEKVTEKAATCLEDGSLAKVCKVCGYTEKETIPATGHDDSNAQYYYVTFDKEGKAVKQGNAITYKAGMTSCEYAIARIFTCSNENNKEIVTIVADKKAHSIDTTKPVTTGIFECNDEGVITIQTDSTGKVVPLTNAVVDCEHAEAQVFTCKTCGKPQYNIITPKKAHTKIATSEVVAKEATCYEEGYTTYSCSTCNKTIKGNVLPKLTHSFVYVPATCTEQADIKCTGCGVEYKTEEASTYQQDAKYKAVYDSLTQAQKDAMTTAPSHDFTGSTTKVVNGLTYKHCNKCNKDIVVSLSFEEEPVKATAPSDKLSTDPEVKAKEEKVNSRMEKVTITRDGNVVTIKQNEAFVSGDISGTNNNDCFGIMMDLGIKAENVEIVSSNPAGYKFNTDGTDTKYEEMQRWNANATENSFMIWLCPNDFTNGARDITITFKDKSENSTTPEPITITFKYVPLAAE